MKNETQFILNNRDKIKVYKEIKENTEINLITVRLCHKNMLYSLP